jgi:hypothetical protein
VGVTTAEIVGNLHIDTHISAVAEPKAEMGPYGSIDHHLHPWEGGKDPAAMHMHPYAEKKCVFAFGVRIFAIPRCVTGRRFR